MNPPIEQWQAAEEREARRQTIDIYRYGDGRLVCKNSETGEIIEGVRSVTLHINDMGLSEACLFIPTQTVAIERVERHDGMRAG